MYEEEKKNSFIKDFIIKLLYMFLFLFLFMWLYPAPKVDLSDVEVKVDKTELKPLFAGIFNDNINAMKESAKSYYTVDRLPKTNGATSKMTLQEMLNRNIVAPFVDANGKSCDPASSFVEVTRVSGTEYTMKVNLVCSDKSDYIIETIGCTSVCPGCVATPASTTTTKTPTTTTKAPTTTIVKPSTTVQTPTPTPTPAPSKTYIYQKEIKNDVWTTDDTWVTTYKTGNDVKVVDTRYVDSEPEYVNRTYTFRTVSWISSYDSTANYTLVLGSDIIPSNATNVRISSSSKITTSSELRSYINNRYSCDIRMDGYNCPRRSDDSIIQDNQLFSTPTPSFSYNLNIYRSGNRWKVDVNTYTYSQLYGDQKYILPIKFVVSWREREEIERVKQYKYSYLKTNTTTDTKYSTSSNDTSLLNDGYKLVGTK